MQLPKLKMRNTFIRDLVQHARKNDKIALIVGDLGFSVVEPFAKEFPDRFINAGVAEQNMTGIAAGMASEGYHVFTYSIANFPLFRCAEQIRNDIDYHNLSVTTVSVGGGLAYGNLGYSHHAVQDFSLMRSMPNILIASPGDPLEMGACLDYLIGNPQPSYLRINKSGEKNIHKLKPVLLPGYHQIIKNNESADKLILTTGAVLESAIKIWESSEELMHKWSVGSLPLWGEAFRKTIHDHLKDYNRIDTIEEHLLSGGFGSFLLESGLNCQAHCLNVAVCGEVGTQDYLKDRFGFNSILRFGINE
jgi:transketolase